MQDPEVPVESASVTFTLLLWKKACLSVYIPLLAPQIQGNTFNIIKGLKFNLSYLLYFIKLVELKINFKIKKIFY